MSQKADPTQGGGSKTLSESAPFVCGYLKEKSYLVENQDWICYFEYQILLSISYTRPSMHLKNTHDLFCQEGTASQSLKVFKNVWPSIIEVDLHKT